PKSILQMINRLVKQKQRFLLFVPRIKDLTLVSNALEKANINCTYLTVYSADPQRLEKVTAMRSQSVDFLITTTILERGVTFPGIDVMVLKADDEVFSTSALVQIAGRVGRNSARPTGQVILYCETKSKTIKSCDRQIKEMNRKAREIK
ncbi:helicase-related protein, partial [Lentilactobacillus hilgardii]